MNYVKPDFKSTNLPIGIMKTEEDIHNLQILERIFTNKSIGCECIKVLHTASYVVYDFELLNYDITFEKIKKLENSLRMFLKTESVFISPSQENIGFTITIAATKRIIIPFNNCMSETIKSNNMILPVTIGYDDMNNPVVFDLIDMPHLLIAGTTGSGKSVCINTIISSIMCNNSPKNVQFIMIDPKQVELIKYDAIPSFMQGPVVTNPYRASSLLYNICANMDLRYQEFSKYNVRNIDEYNKLNLPHKYTRCILVVDELADLMIKCKKEIEKYLVRIAQLGRACGLHLICATQRPSHDIITGLLKANFPAKICFKVATPVNSRVVLDTTGAEKLLGKGDGLFQNSDGSNIIRFQSAYITSEEIDNIINHINSQL